jgi:hypothetical protein
MFEGLAVGVPAWPPVGRGFDATPLIAVVGTFTVAVLLFRVPINGGTMVRTAVVALILGSIAGFFGPATALSWAVFFALLAAVASKRAPSTARRRQPD